MTDRYLGHRPPTYGQPGSSAYVSSYKMNDADPNPTKLGERSEPNDVEAPNPDIIDFWNWIQWDNPRRAYALAWGWWRAYELFELTANNLHSKAITLANNWQSPEAKKAFLEKVGGAIRSLDEWRDHAYHNYSKLVLCAAQLDTTKRKVRDVYKTFVSSYNANAADIYSAPRNNRANGVLNQFTDRARPAMKDLQEVFREAYLESGNRWMGPTRAKKPDFSKVLPQPGGTPAAPRPPVSRPPTPSVPASPPPPHPAVAPVQQPSTPPPSGPVLQGGVITPPAPPVTGTPPAPVPPAGGGAAPPPVPPGLATPPPAPTTGRGTPGPAPAAGRPGAPPAAASRPPAAPPASPAARSRAGGGNPANSGRPPVAPPATGKPGNPVTSRGATRTGGTGLTPPRGAGVSRPVTPPVIGGRTGSAPGVPATGRRSGAASPTEPGPIAIRGRRTEGPGCPTAPSNDAPRQARTTPPTIAGGRGPHSGGKTDPAGRSKGGVRSGLDGRTAVPGGPDLSGRTGAQAARRHPKPQPGPGDWAEDQYEPAELWAVDTPGGGVIDGALPTARDDKPGPALGR